MNFYYDLPHFSPVKAELAESSTLVYDPQLICHLQEAYHFVKKTQNFSGEKNNSTRYINVFKELISEELESNDLPPEELITRLSFTTNIQDQSFFDSRDEFENKHMQHELFLCEKFMGSDEIFNSGSSRHIFLRGLDIKGAGRNCLAHRPDFEHSWGGLRLNDAIMDYFYGNVIHYSSPLGAERIIAIALLKNHTNKALSFRQRSSMRLCNSSVSLRHKFSVLALSELMKSFHSPQNFLDCHVIQLTSTMLNGFYHGSLTPDNHLVSGKFIDNHSFLPAKELNTFQFKVFIKDESAEFESDFSNIDLFLSGCEERANEFRITQSDFYNYYRTIDNVIIAVQKNNPFDNDKYISDPVGLWVSVLERYFNVSSEMLENIAFIFSNLKCHTPFTGVVGLFDCIKRLASIKDLYISHEYIKRDAQHYLTFSIKIPDQDRMDICSYKHEVKSDLEKNFKTLQEMFAARLKFDLPLHEWSQKSLFQCYKSVLPAHYIIMGGEIFKNQFDSKRLATFLKKYYQIEEDAKLQLYDLKLKSNQQIPFHQLSLLKGTFLLQQVELQKRLTYISPICVDC